jgi:hypothetical protein
MEVGRDPNWGCSAIRKKIRYCPFLFVSMISIVFSMVPYGMMNFRQQLTLLIPVNGANGAVRTGVYVKLSRWYAKHHVMKMYGVVV